MSNHMPLTISEQELDALPFGVIQIDPDGKILRYNAYESALSGLAPETVMGKNFFRDVAPCTRHEDFLGRFEAERSNSHINLQFGFIFPFATQTRRVFIHILPGPAESFWIFVSESASDRSITNLLHRSQSGEANGPKNHLSG